MAKKLRVGVIFGGRSAEHEISVMSAKYIMEILNPDHYEVVPIGITREGQWLLAEDVKWVIEELKKNKRGSFEELINTDLTTISPKALVMLKQNVDVVFPVLHGRYGEDGTIQGLLEQLDVPYVGCKVLASALAMDKAATKAILKAHRIPVVEGLMVLRKNLETCPEEVIRNIESEMRYPCFVKPANSGSSIAVSKVSCQDKLKEALRLAAAHDRRILVEEAIEGREIEVAVFGNEDPFVSVPGEVVSSREFYDYEAKYSDDGAKIHIPADLPNRMSEKIQAMAIEVFAALDCCGMARVDFFLTRNNKLYVNEVNTIPGFTAYSMYPKLWEASGVKAEKLVERLISLALERYQDELVF